MTRTNDLPAARACLEKIGEGPVLAAVSGGLDSMCLLEMTVRQGQKQGRRVAAAHFNHQLRGAEHMGRKKILRRNVRMIQYIKNRI